MVTVEAGIDCGHGDLGLELWVLCGWKTFVLGEQEQTAS